MTDTVLVTGFGPFRDYKINASWEIAKLLPKMNLEEEFGIRLITKEVCVAYDSVNKLIPELWKEHNPQLVIHIGVSSIASKITLESMAHKSGYQAKDIFDQLPEHGCCQVGDNECITTAFDLLEVCNEINEQDATVKTCISHNAGRYLCEFTYYTSLMIDHSRVLFIHVPDLNKPYTAEEMASCVKKIIHLLLGKIRNCQKLK